MQNESQLLSLYRQADKDGRRQIIRYAEFTVLKQEQKRQAIRDQLKIIKGTATSGKTDF